MDAADRPRIAVFDRDPGIRELYRELCEDGGIGVAVAAPEATADVWEVVAFLRRTAARALLWDVAPPYDRSCRLLQQLRDAGDLAGRTVIVTTTNKSAVDALIGRDVAAILAKPFDIDVLADLLRAAIAQARPPPHGRAS